jgi:hypothetical protein
MLFTANSNDFQSTVFSTYGFLIHSILSVQEYHNERICFCGMEINCVVDGLMHDKIEYSAKTAYWKNSDTITSNEKILRTESFYYNSTEEFEEAKQKLSEKTAVSFPLN